MEEILFFSLAYKTVHSSYPLQFSKPAHSPSLCHALTSVASSSWDVVLIFPLLIPAGSSDAAKSTSFNRLGPLSLLFQGIPSWLDYRICLCALLQFPDSTPPTSSFCRPVYEQDPLSALSQPAGRISGYKIADSHICIPKS